jgi:hypothetical protein
MRPPEFENRSISPIAPIRSTIRFLTGCSAATDEANPWISAKKSLVSRPQDADFGYEFAKLLKIWLLGLDSNQQPSG